jgi:hypothetical protein
MIVQISKGGNAIAKNSALTKQKIDSLHQIFIKFLPPEIVRFGNLTPRLVYKKRNKTSPYIKSTVYEMRDGSLKPIVQFMIDFDKMQHNNMPDVVNILISNPDVIKPQDVSSLKSLLKRKATVAERNITPPRVAR